MHFYTVDNVTSFFSPPFSSRTSKNVQISLRSPFSKLFLTIFHFLTFYPSSLHHPFRVSLE